MDESDQQQPNPGDMSSGSGASGWAARGIEGPPTDPASGTKRAGATAQSSAVTSGSPIPTRPATSGEPADSQYAITGALVPSPKEPSQMAPKAVVAVVAAAVVLTLGVVVILYLMTQGSDEPRPAADDRTIAPPPATGPADATGLARQVDLEGLSLLLPAGWSFEKVQGGYNLGPPSNPSQVRIYLNYKGTSLQRLRPVCETPDDEAREPAPSPDQDETESPIPASPSPSPSPSITPAYSGILKDTYTLVGGQQATSESGSLECDSEEARPFTSIIVARKGFAMTFGEPTGEVDELINSIVFT